MQESADRLRELTASGAANATVLRSSFARAAAAREQSPPVVRSILRTVEAFELKTQKKVDRVLRGVHPCCKRPGGRSHPPGPRAPGVGPIPGTLISGAGWGMM